MADIIVYGIFMIAVTVLYMRIKLTSIKTKGLCIDNWDLGRQGCKGRFEYEIERKKYYNYEHTTHNGLCKVGKIYTIYVNKKNYHKIFSQKVLRDYMVFMILFGGVTVSLIITECYSMLH